MLSCDSQFIITDGRRIFVLFEDFSVLEASKYAAAGCTDDIAFTSLMHAPTDEPAEQTILNVLRRSACRSPYVGPPYCLVNTTDGLFRLEEV